MARFPTRKGVLWLGGPLKSGLVACTLTQLPPETEGTQTPRWGIDKTMVKMTPWEGGCPFPTIFSLFYSLNSLFVLPTQVQNPIHCVCGVNCFSCDILLPHLKVYQKVPKDLQCLLPTKVKIVRTCSAGTDALTCGALATQFCHHG